MSKNMKYEALKSKSGKTACQIYYEEKAMCSFWRLDECQWYMIDCEDYFYEEKWVLKEHLRKQLEKLDKKEFDPLQCEISMSEGMI